MLATGPGQHLTEIAKCHRANSGLDRSYWSGANAVHDNHIPDYYAAVLIGCAKGLAGLVCLSVRPSVPYGFLTRKQKMRRKTKICVNVPEGRSNRLPFFGSKCRRSRASDVKNLPQNNAYLACMFTYGWRIARWPSGQYTRSLHTRCSPKQLV